MEVMNKCYNPILYSCQFLELSFLVRYIKIIRYKLFKYKINIFRYPDGVSDEMSTDYDIVAVTEDITYNDGASGSVTYCPPMQGTGTL